MVATWFKFTHRGALAALVFGFNVRPWLWLGNGEARPFLRPARNFSPHARPPTWSWVENSAGSREGAPFL